MNTQTNSSVAGGQSKLVSHSSYLCKTSGISKQARVDSFHFKFKLRFLRRIVIAAAVVVVAVAAVAVAVGASATPFQIIIISMQGTHNNPNIGGRRRGFHPITAFRPFLALSD